MNIKEITLKFIINNEDKGDFYTYIPINKTIFPVFSFIIKIFLFNIDC